MITSLSHNVQLYFGKHIEAKLSSRRLELTLAYSLCPLSLLASEGWSWDPRCFWTSQVMPFQYEEEFSQLIGFLWETPLFLFGPSIFSATSFPFAVRINDSSAPFPVLITIFLRSRIVISFQAEKGPVSFMDLLLYFEAASFNSSFRKLGGLSSLNAFTIAKAPDPGCGLNPSPGFGIGAWLTPQRPLSSSSTQFEPHCLFFAGFDGTLSSAFLFLGG